MDAKLIGQSDEAFDRGVAWLHQRQLPSGEFPVEVTWKLDKEETLRDTCLFPTALVAQCLLTLPASTKTEEMLANACRFFLAQMKPGGLWSHFPFGHGWDGVCGPDADDTSCISHVLQARGITEPSKRNIRLLLLNRNRKGLFYTWFVTRFCLKFDLEYWRILLAEWRHPRSNLRYWMMIEGKRNKAEGVVNANVLYYLGDISETQPVIEFLNHIVTRREEAESDLWYRDLNVIYYFFSRNYARGIRKLEPAKQPMIDRIKASARPDGQLGETIVETAMGACALLNLGVPASQMDSTFRHVLQAQLPDGGWAHAPVYYGGPSRRTLWGSQELTTAFCLEFLCRFRTAVRSGTERQEEL